MSVGLNSGPQVFDPTTKRETWLFQRIGTDRSGDPSVNGRKGRPIYRRLPYNLVAYDGDPTQYLEPDTASGDFVKVLDGSGDPIDARVDGMGAVVDFKFFDARPFEIFSINDVDATKNLGQLP